MTRSAPSEAADWPRPGPDHAGTPPIRLGQDPGSSQASGIDPGQFDGTVQDTAGRLQQRLRGESGFVHHRQTRRAAARMPIAARAMPATRRSASSVCRPTSRRASPSDAATTRPAARGHGVRRRRRSRSRGSGLCTDRDQQHLGDCRFRPRRRRTRIRQLCRRCAASPIHANTPTSTSGSQPSVTNSRGAHGRGLRAREEVPGAIAPKTLRLSEPRSSAGSAGRNRRVFLWGGPGVRWRAAGTPRARRWDCTSPMSICPRAPEVLLDVSHYTGAGADGARASAAQRTLATPRPSWIWTPRAGRHSAPGDPRHRQSHERRVGRAARRMGHVPTAAGSASSRSRSCCPIAVCSRSSRARTARASWSATARSRIRRPMTRGGQRDAAAGCGRRLAIRISARRRSVRTRRRAASPRLQRRALPPGAVRVHAEGRLRLAVRRQHHRGVDPARGQGRRRDLDRLDVGSLSRDHAAYASQASVVASDYDATAGAAHHLPSARCPT